MRKILIIFLLLGFTIFCYATENKLIFKKQGNEKLYFWGYGFCNNKFIICIRKNNNESYFQFDSDKLIEVKIADFKECEVTKEFYDSWKTLKENIFPNNNVIKKYCSGGVKYNDKEYIVCLNKEYHEPELCLFNGVQFKKIEMGNVYAVVGLGDTFIFYDKQYDKLYFTGYKKEHKKEIYSSFGFYVYDFKKKNVILLQEADAGYDLIAPYKIPGTNKIIFIKNGKHPENFGIQEIYIRNALK